MVSALLAVQHGDDARAWALFARVEKEHPQSFSNCWHATPLVLRNYASAARRSGHQVDAERLTTRYRQQPAFRLDDYVEVIRGHEVVDPRRDKL